MSDGAGVSGGRKTGPSDAAYAAAWGVFESDGRIGWKPHPLTVEAALNAAHSPSLGEDRSVRLGDVLDALRGHGRFASDYPDTHLKTAADFLLRSFTEDSA